MLIGEVSRRSGVSSRMLRHYDTLGLVRPTGRTAGGYREYSDQDVARIFHVESLRSLGLSLAEVQQALDDPGFAPDELVDRLIERTRHRLAREEELLARLQRVASTRPTDWADVLRIISLLRGLGSTDAMLRQRAALTPGGAPVPAESLAAAVLAETEPNTAGALRWALARVGREGVAAVASGLDSPDAEVRRRAVTALAEVADEEAATLLGRALTDPDEQVRDRAALALGRQGRSTALPGLVALVVEGRNDVEAAELLAGLAGPDASPASLTAALLAGAGEDATPAVRRRLAQALAELPGDAARAALARLTQDEDPAVSLTAEAILRRRPPA